MADGMLTEIAVVARGTETMADASAVATVITVEDTTQFDVTGRVEIDGEQYDYTAVDSDALTITLATGLADAVDAYEPVIVVAGGVAVYDWIATVAFDGGDVVDVSVPYAMRSQWIEGAYDPPVPVRVSDDLAELVDAPGRTPVLNGSSLDPSTIPDRQPSEAPESSPAVRAYGDAEGFTLVTDSIEASTTLDFYVNGTLTTEAQGLDTHSMVVRLLLDENGDPFIAADEDGNPVTYAFHVVAKNVVGSADPSDDVAASLNMGVSPEFISAKIEAGFVLAGTIQVGGNITIDPDNGIQIETDDGLILFPTDGSSAIITSTLTTYSTNSMDQLTIAGANNALSGSLALQSSTTAPQLAPTVLRTTFGPDSLTPSGIDDFTSWHSLVDYDEDTWVVQRGKSIWKIDKATGAGTLWYDTVLNVGGNAEKCLTKIGDNWWTLLAGAAEVFKYDSSFTLIDSFALDGPEGYPSAFGTDGTDLYYVVRDKLVVFNGTFNFVRQLPDVIRLRDGGPGTIMYGTFDYGADRLLIADGKGVRSFTLDVSAATEVTSERFNNMNNNVSAFAWDGERFWGVSEGDPTIRQYSKQRTQETGIDISYTFYDSTDTTHETKPSPAFNTPRSARGWLHVIGAKLPADPGENDPDEIGVYANNHLQGYDASSEFYIDVIDTGGAAPPTVEGFPQGTLGRLYSQDADSDGDPIFEVKGDGSLRAAKTMQAGTVSITSTGSSSPYVGTADVTFDPPFDEVPSLTVSVDGSRPDYNHASWTGLSKTGVTILLVRTNAAGSNNVGWQAIAATQ